ncbi:hypothetical protein K431DRAFT_161386 [Polychaeton citri CBS 116435]|uniref:RhoGAP-domain-containing protein n=1 Tax=Polychaeton citri CBS 116435 TaxID=1314669 RepID=A0A9P4Q2A8_9PEZI|nr:hypothetical protein K431DRAFT_161386 [Polychaeton citri CBS 116435]
MAHYTAGRPGGSNPAAMLPLSSPVPDRAHSHHLQQHDTHTDHPPSTPNSDNLRQAHAHAHAHAHASASARDPDPTSVPPAEAQASPSPPPPPPPPPLQHSIQPHHLRTPKPSKKVTTPRPEFDEIRAAVERDALRKEAKKAASRSLSSPREPNVTSAAGATPPTAAAAATAAAASPPSSPGIGTMATSPHHTARTTPAQPNHMMSRGGSIDSTISAGSTANTGASHKHTGSNALKVSPESASPRDIAQLISAAGSAEAVIAKLIGEKNTAASHNAQLWRLVEKQRAMIYGLNKDLEKSLKEKERYRRKLKENLAQSQSAPLLTTALSKHDEDAMAREASQSPVSVSVIPANLRDMSLDSGKVSDVSDVASGRSDTPQEAGSMVLAGQPATPRSAGSTPMSARAEGDMSNKEEVTPSAYTKNRFDTIRTLVSPVSLPGSSRVVSPTTPSLASPGKTPSFSSPKQASRKAPPAPLQLSPLPTPNIANNIVDPSDSEYEDDPDEARAEQMRRGRRKTREEDDREREYMAQKELESRSKSKREKKSKSKSKSKTPAGAPAMPTEPAQIIVQEATAPDMPAPTRRAPGLQLDDPRAIINSRAAADAAGMLQRTVTAPSLLSPGLPMSPRPSDRPMNSPMPRAPNKALNSIPMSPRIGLPLSPRAPNKAIPLPPQTPLTFASPHLARANNYHEQMVQQPSIADRLNQTSQSSSFDSERTFADPASPGEIFQGLVSEQYPDLLMPPNALPSIYVKVASSRMRPSRYSYVATKHAAEENPVFTMGVYARSDNKQLWRVEKTHAALVFLDQDVKSLCTFRDRVPDRNLFTGHAPAKIDARRLALNTYFERMLDSIHDEGAAMVVCRFLSTEATPAEGASEKSELRPDSPMSKTLPRREGYLTKRGKNFGGWKARYFVLDGPQLKYFEAPGGAHLGSIRLQNAQIGKQSSHSNQSQEDEDNQFRHAFLVLEPKRKDSTSLVRHVLCAESDSERDAWVEALLAYVDYSEIDDLDKSMGQGVNPDMGGPHSPRQQKSLQDLRPPSRGKETSRNRLQDHMRSIGYKDTVAGDAPIMGAPPSAQKAGTPSPPHDGGFSDHTPSHHPTISAPTNAIKIDNAGDWGMKVPPTPGHVKDKKRSIFAGFRGRSSSDIDAREKGLLGQENGIRAVFGVPLAEAVEYAHPVGVTTELPAVVYRCIEYLTAKNAILEEGIFRLSGSNTVIKALRERFNTEGDVNLNADGKYYDIHAVASLLKLYLRELPSSILTRDLHLEFLQCVEMSSRDKTNALNVLVHRLPKPNFELLRTLTAFLRSIVDNADVNKMNVRNVGIVFSPTLNVPAPLISSFVEDQNTIFGAAIEESESPIVEREVTMPSAAPSDFRSPRKQMFTDLATPSYNQTSFQSFGAIHSPRPGKTQFSQSDMQNQQPIQQQPQQHQHQRGVSDKGFAPVHQSQNYHAGNANAHAHYPQHGSYQIAQHGDGGFGSLNDALAPSVQHPTVYGTAANGQPTPRQKKRESAAHMLNTSGLMSPQKKPSLSRLQGGEGEGGSF